MEVLNSEPPIIVCFKVLVPRENNFGYGDRVDNSKLYIFLFSLLLVGSIFVSYLMTSMIKFDKLKWNWLFSKDKNKE
jgi:hypothetical protein